MKPIDTKLNLFGDINDYRSKRSRYGVDVAPNVTQIAALQRVQGGMDIAFSVLELLIDRFFERIELPSTCIPALRHHIQGTEQTDDPYAHVNPEGKRAHAAALHSLREITDRLHINLDIPEPLPVIHFLGKPTWINYELKAEEFRFHTNSAGTINCTMADGHEFNSLFESPQPWAKILMAALYILDQRVLINERRGQGKSLDRFIRVYSSRPNNKTIETEYYQLMTAYRLLSIESIDKFGLDAVLLRAKSIPVQSE